MKTCQKNRLLAAPRFSTTLRKNENKNYYNFDAVENQNYERIIRNNENKLLIFRLSVTQVFHRREFNNNRILFSRFICR